MTDRIIRNRKDREGYAFTTLFAIWSTFKIREYEKLLFSQVLGCSAQNK